MSKSNRASIKISCGCVIEHPDIPGLTSLLYCDLHAAAGLLAACKIALDRSEIDDAEFGEESNLTRQLRAALAAAEPTKAAATRK